MTTSKAPSTIDLNSDMGEGFGAYKMGDDEGILKIVSSANVACGYHAGDPEIMARTFAIAKENGVTAGAHPGFPDLWGFGRRHIPFTPGEIERLVAYQIGAAQALATYAGNPLKYVKAHGQLGHLTYGDESVAKAFANAIKAVDPRLVCTTFPNGHLPGIARDMGLSVACEVFADRGYTEEGFLVNRKLPGALLHDPQEAAARMLRMVQAQGVETLSGRMIPMEFHTICMHSDTPGALAMAAQVRSTLEEAGIRIQAFA